MTIVRFDTEGPTKFPRKISFICGVLILVLVIAQIWANNTLASVGENFEALREKEQALQLENQILTNKIAELSSLSKIASESAALGLYTPKSIQYVQ